jgi:hypothetical protein
MMAEQEWRSLVGQVRRAREEALPRQEFFEWTTVSGDETEERKLSWAGRTATGFGFEFVGEDESPESRLLVGSGGSSRSVPLVAPHGTER